MSTKAYIPVGAKGKYETVEKGDIVELVTGEKVTFLEMKRVNWSGEMNGKGISVPVYRNKTTRLPYIKAIVGKDKSVIVAGIKPSKLKPGQLFFLEGHKETFMFIGTDVKRGGKQIVNGYDLATGKRYSIAADMKMVALNINKLKKELINA